MSSGNAWSLSTQSDRFKIKYGKLADKVFNAGNPITMQVPVKNDFVGKQMTEDNPLGFSGSVGSRVMPKSNTGNYANSTIFSKKLYATVIVDRESMKASSTTEGAFFKFMDKPVKDAMESFDRNKSRMFFNDGSGVLGRGFGVGPAAVTGNGSVATPYVVSFDITEFFDANFEEKDFVQMVSGITDLGATGKYQKNAGGTAEGADTEVNLLEVVEVNSASLQIKLVGTSAILAAHVAGASALAATDAIVMQRSYQGDMSGIRLASSLSEQFDLAVAVEPLYGIPVQRRWRMYVLDAGNSALSIAMINQVAIGIEKRCGKAITMIAASYEQFTKLLDLQETQKRYTTVMPANPAFKKAVYGFEAVEYMTTTGPVPVIADRMIHADEIFLLNKNYIEYRLRPDGAKWADEDGTVFLRTGNDSYEATYACYGELFISPGYHGHLKGLKL